MKPNAPVLTQKYNDFKQDDKSYLFKFYNETTTIPRDDSFKFIMFNAFVNIEHGKININVRCVSDSSEHFNFSPYDYTEFMISQLDYGVTSVSYESVAKLIKEYIIDQLQKNIAVQQF